MNSLVIVGFAPLVGVSLLAIAMCQSTMIRLT